MARQFLLALAPLLISITPVAAKEYRAQRFDVHLRLEQGGAAHVRETVIFQFGDGPFTYVFRDLPVDRNDGISDIRVFMDGRELPEGAGPGRAEIKRRDPLRVTWHFAPVAQAAHTFELSYRVHGALKSGTAADTLSWPAIPRDRSYAIDGGALSLEFPESAALQEPPALTGAKAGTESRPGRVFLSLAAPLEEEHGVTLEAAFAAGRLISGPPRWQARDLERKRQSAGAVPVGIGAFFVVLLGGSFLLQRARASSQNYGEPRRGVSVRVTQPPGTVAPAIAAQLASGETGATAQLALATLFDFARRGIIRIEEKEKTWIGRSFVALRGETPAAPAPHEQALLDILFVTRRGRREMCKLAEFGQALASGGSRFTNAVQAEMVALGLVDVQSRAVRRRILIRSAFAFLGSVLLGIAGFAFRAASAEPSAMAIALGILGAAAALFVVGVAAVIAGTSISSRTVQGASAAEAWRGFAAYLKDVTKEREPGPGREAFEPWLPYAAGFGLAEAWTKYYRKQGVTETPEWFHALETADGTEMAAMVALMSVSSSSAGAGSGAGGAGGGASGAG